MRGWWGGAWQGCGAYDTACGSKLEEEADAPRVREKLIETSEKTHVLRGVEFQMSECTMLPGLLCDEAVWDDLVDRLAVYDVTYLTGGSAERGQQSPYRGPN